MIISLLKPSLSYRNQSEEPTITIFTNQLETVNRTCIINYLLLSNKLSYFGIKHDEILDLNSIAIVTAEPTVNLNIDQLLQQDKNLLKYKIQFPLNIEIILVNHMNCINSFTKEFALGKNILKERKIGEGTFAQVFQCREITNKKVCCVKRINKAECQKKGELQYISNQFQVLTEVDCSEFIQLYYAFEDSKSVFFVMEMCAYGDLFTEIRERFELVSLRQKYYWFIQIALGITRLHKCGYLYRDLKPENILIDFEGNAKICDFGYSCRYEAGQLLHQVCGSYEYIPPQLVNKQGYNHSFDLYCLGLLFLELLTGSNPFEGVTPHSLQEIVKRKVEYNPKYVPEEAKSLISKLMEKDPKKRLGYDNSQDIFKHQFFTLNREIVVKVIKREGIDERTMDYKLKNLEYSEVSGKSIPKVLPVDFYNYLKPNFKMTQQYGPKVTPI